MIRGQRKELSATATATLQVSMSDMEAHRSISGRQLIYYLG